jgi:hypothetical protein
MNARDVAISATYAYTPAITLRGNGNYHDGQFLSDYFQPNLEPQKCVS